MEFNLQRIKTSYFFSSNELNTTLFFVVKKINNVSNFSDCAVKEPSLLAKDEDLAKRLWEESAKLTGVDWDPKEFSNVK